MPTPKLSGKEFLVNTTTNSDQFGPDVTGLTNGRFVVTWTDASGNNPDLNSLGCRAQIFNADGSKFGAEIVVNTTVNNIQNEPQITALSDGRFAITFQDNSLLNTANPDSVDVRVQVFGPDGIKQGVEFVAPATSIAVQSEPAIAGLHNGRYVVVWTDSSATGGDTSGDAIRSQVFNADGTRFGIERLVNTTTTGIQNDPAVTALANGDYVVAWTSAGVDGMGLPLRSINSQLFHANGVAVGTEFLGAVVGGFNTGQSEASITSLTGGRYVLTWTDVAGFQTDIHGQIFNQNGTTHGGVFTVNATTADSQAVSSVTALQDGGFVVVWVDNGPFNGTGFNPEIRAQAYHANGNTAGPEFLVNTTTDGLQRAPNVAGLADGRFVVTWEDKSGTLGDTTFAVHAQIFDPRTAAVSLAGTSAADNLVGTSFADTIAGNGGDDILLGAGGNDRIAGGTGSDRLTGGGGADVFVFAPADGHDRITDFTDGSDKIDLTGFGFASFPDAKAHFADAGSVCVFTFGSDVLTVNGLALAQIVMTDLLI